MLSRFSDWNAWPSFGWRDKTRGFETFDQLRREMDRLFVDFERQTPRVGSGYPEMAFEDRGDAWVLRAEVPGLSEKDVELNVTATTVTLRGERKLEAPQGYSTHRNERAGFSFTRSFEFPNKVDPDKVEASLKHGVLTVTLPKAAEARPKQITVKAS